MNLMNGLSKQILLMRTIFLLITLNLILANAKGQKALEIPEFKNINTDDKYPERSILALYTNNFDILISLNCYSAWGYDNSIKVFAHHVSGWYKIEINRDEKTLDPYTVCYSTYKIDDSIGNILWDTLKQNHLFDMKDERQIPVEICPPIIIDTVIENGKKQIISRGTSGSDMPEFEFEIITSKNYKKLYFYSPKEKYGSCPKANELKWLVNCITVFEKYLGM